MQNKNTTSSLRLGDGSTGEEVDMSKFGKYIAAALFAAFSVAASASSTVLNMSGLQNEEPIENYFDGGLGGLGSGPGPSDGVVFSGNSLAIISETMGGGGNFQNNPSGGPIAFFLSGSGDEINIAGGVTGGFSFYYSSADAGDVTVWSGLDGTGTELASIDLSAQFDVDCAAGSVTSFCNWTAGGATFSGTAESIDFNGVENEVGFDEITLGSGSPGNSGVTPEPGTFVLFGSGLIALAGAVRRRFSH